jgi:hypothetical protein
MSFNKERFWKVMEIAEKRGLYVRLAEEYSEPGYRKDGEGPILFADWNSDGYWDREQNKYITTNDSPERLSKLFEKLGCTIEWEDEWEVCESCENAFRIAPDSYCWTRYGYVDENFCMCGDCIKENPEQYLDSLENNPEKANTILDLEDHGYVCLTWNKDGIPERYENGLYGGQCADPHVIAKSLNERKVRYIFSIESTGQFDTDFTVWIRREDLGLDRDVEFWHDIYAAICEFRRTPIAVNGLDPAVMMQNALKDASEKMGKLSGPGIRYAKCEKDGTADVRLVSQEEFVRGIEK